MPTNEEIARRWAECYRREGESPVDGSAVDHLALCISKAINEATGELQKRVEGYGATCERFEKRIDQLREYMKAETQGIHGSPDWVEGFIAGITIGGEKLNYFFLSPAKEQELRAQNRPASSPGNDQQGDNEEE